MSELFDGLGPNGKLHGNRCGIRFPRDHTGTVGYWKSNHSRLGAGTSADEEDTLHFAELTGVRPMIETYPLEKADEAYARMMSGKAQFRVVLTM